MSLIHKCKQFCSVVSQHVFIWGLQIFSGRRGIEFYLKIFYSAWDGRDRSSSRQVVNGEVYSTIFQIRSVVRIVFVASACNELLHNIIVLPIIGTPKKFDPRVGATFRGFRKFPCDQNMFSSTHHNCQTCVNVEGVYQWKIYNRFF